jgi:tRNA U34 2-thiouridine synthase MnmA/TrmU
MEHARFPLGGLRKKEVRQLARTLSLATEARKDSQGA